MTQAKIVQIIHTRAEKKRFYHPRNKGPYDVITDSVIGL